MLLNLYFPHFSFYNSNKLSHIVIFMGRAFKIMNATNLVSCVPYNMFSLWRVTLSRLGKFLFIIPAESVISVNVFLQPNPTEAKAGRDRH